MKTGRLTTITLICAICVIAVFLWIIHTRTPGIRDYDRIAQEKSLRVAVITNSEHGNMTTDSIGGFHGELIRLFAMERGWNVIDIPFTNPRKATTQLKRGRTDILAADITKSVNDTSFLLYTYPLYKDRLVLVQRKVNLTNDSLRISNVLEMANQTITLPPHTPFITRVKHLSDEIGDTIYIKKSKRRNMWQIFEDIAFGITDYTVCQESSARKASLEYPNLDINTVIGFNQFHCWATNKRAPVLTDSINIWLQAFTQTAEYKDLLKKYGLNNPF